MEGALTSLAKSIALADQGELLFVTGAGISLASGIPTFRGQDKGAVWSKDVLEKGTFDYFLRAPIDSWRWYLGRFAGLEGKKPNAGRVHPVAVPQTSDEFDAPALGLQWQSPDQHLLPRFLRWCRTIGASVTAIAHCVRESLRTRRRTQGRRLQST